MRKAEPSFNCIPVIASPPSSRDNGPTFTSVLRLIPVRELRAAGTEPARVVLAAAIPATTPRGLHALQVSVADPRLKLWLIYSLESFMSNRPIELRKYSEPNVLHFEAGQRKLRYLRQCVLI